MKRRNDGEERSAKRAKIGLVISSAFDSGNIELVDGSNPSDVQLKMKKETFTEYDQTSHMQWFHFSVSNCLGTPLCLKIINAGKASYPSGYKGYWAFVSYDRVNWTRTKTSFDGETIQIEVTPEQNVVWVAYFPPYSYEDHMKLVSFAAAQESCEHEAIGSSVQGRPIDLLKVGSGDLKMWIIARQHPGESQAEWWMDGFLHELLSDKGKKLWTRATLYIIPNMNPDGSVNGHLRTNAVGANLNREWWDTPGKNYNAPTKERSPEVLCTLQKMEETGVDFFLDIHGDEDLPCNFLAGEHGVESWNDKKSYIFQRFSQIVVEKTKPLFQTRLGYGTDEVTKGNLAMASTCVAHKFGCVGLTLEMPYKNLKYPEERSWTHEDCKLLGSKFVPALEEACSLLKDPVPETLPVLEPWAKAGYKCPTDWEEPSYA